jgi:general stress protein YciG
MPLDRQEAGARGGRETFRRHGRKHMQEIGAKGFAATVARHWQGDRKGYLEFLLARGWNRLADSFADREIARRLEAGEQAACVELAYRDEGDWPF